jgi:hypothetical protein
MNAEATCALGSHPSTTRLSYRFCPNQTRKKKWVSRCASLKRSKGLLYVGFLCLSLFVQKCSEKGVDGDTSFWTDRVKSGWTHAVYLSPTSVKKLILILGTLAIHELSVLKARRPIVSRKWLQAWNKLGATFISFESLLRHGS